MDFEDLDLQSRQRLGESLRRRFENAMATDDDQSHTQRLIQRVREPEYPLYGQNRRTKHLDIE